MRKAGISFLAVVFVVLWACAGIGMASIKIQDERTQSAKPHVSSGYIFNAAVKADGTLWTWGYDQRAAQLGFNIFRPGQIGTDNDWSTVSAGGDLVDAQIAAIKTEGTLWTWAWPLRWDHVERLGDRPISKVPVQVGKDRDWVAVSVGGDHLAALKRDGTLWTWGDNQHGQLGDGTTISRSAPIQVGKDRDWAAVSSGAHHTAALKADGTLWTWGWNMFGQLGIGTGGDIRAPRSYADELKPVKVGEDRWAAVFAGLVQTAAVKKDGTLWIWGMHGIAAPGVDRIQVRPLRVNRDNDWASVSLGKDHAAALKTDGTLWVWGHNGFGKLGIGEDFIPFAPGASFGRGRPVQAGKDRDWLAVSVGTHHTTALKADGTLWTWGLNLHGQLGDGTFPFRNAPALVSLTTDNGANTGTTTPRTIKIYPRQRSNAVPAALDGEPLPFIESGRVLVPLRFLSEQLGAVVRFDQARKEVAFTKGMVTVRLQIGEKSAHVFQDDATPKTVVLDVPIRVLHGRTMVPLRFVSEVLGTTVTRTDSGNIIIRQYNKN